MEATENNLIVIKQLPVIEDQLAAVKESITRRVNEALSLVCTEETYKDVKKVRAELNKEYAELEARWKEVKAAVLAPYERFERVYKDCAGDLYADADRKLKIKISEVETGLKSQKEEAVVSYFNELRDSLGLKPEDVSFRNSGIKVGLADSVTGLKKKAKDFLDRVNMDYLAICGLDDSAEILIEYWKSFDMGQAVGIVAARKKAIEEERKRREAAEAARAAREAAAQQVEEIVPPVPEAVAAPIAAPVEAPVETPVVVETTDRVPPAEPVEPTYVTTFMVRGTIEMLKALKRFLEEGGYQYESV